MAALFLPDAELTDDAGNLHKGRKEIEEVMQMFFERFPGANCSNKLRPAGRSALRWPFKKACRPSSPKTARRNRSINSRPCLSAGRRLGFRDLPTNPGRSGADTSRTARITRLDGRRLGG